MEHELTGIQRTYAVFPSRLIHNNKNETPSTDYMDLADFFITVPPGPIVRANHGYLRNLESRICVFMVF